MSDAQDGGRELYHYDPSLALAVVATVVFGLLTTAHIYRMARTRSWFCAAFVVGGIFETVGYIGRILGSSDPDDLGFYILQTLLILLGPALFAATIYMTLSRIILAVRAPHLSIIRVSWQTKIFVFGDVLSFITQCGGGGLQASSNPDTIDVGQKITIAGLALQLLFFGFFMICSAIFHKRCVQRPTVESMDPKMPWQKMMIMLYTVSGLILVRSIFRVVEYVQGRDGYLLSIEWPIYTFDALLMAITMLIFLVWYPSTLQSRLKEVSGEPLEELYSFSAEGRQNRSSV